jgi:hypothetical protein
MYNSLHLQLFYHLCRYEIVCATAVHYDLAYPILSFSSSPKQTVSLGWVLCLIIQLQENFPHHQRSSALSIFCLNIPSLSFNNVSFTTIFLLIWTLIGFMSDFSTYETFYFTSSTSFSSSSLRKSISISILPSL